MLAGLESELSTIVIGAVLPAGGGFAGALSGDLHAVAADHEAIAARVGRSARRQSNGWMTPAMPGGSGASDVAASGATWGSRAAAAAAEETLSAPECQEDVEGFFDPPWAAAADGKSGGSPPGRPGTAWEGASVLALARKGAASEGGCGGHSSPDKSEGTQLVTLGKSRAAAAPPEEQLEAEARHARVLQLLYTSLDQDVYGPSACELSGQVPSWLRGKLLRIGPGLFECGKRHLKSAHDGFAVFSGFEFTDAAAAATGAPRRAGGRLRPAAVGTRVHPDRSDSAGGATGAAVTFQQRFMADEAYREVPRPAARQNVTSAGEPALAWQKMPKPRPARAGA